MKKCLIFGTGSTGRRILNLIRSKYEVLGFLDNDTTKWGTSVENIPVLGNTIPDKLEYDEVFVCSLPAMAIIKEQLLESGIPDCKINTELISVQVNARINFLRDYSALINPNNDLSLAVAEGGVYQGDFSKIINECFPHNRLYLFDTFEGFDSRDIEIEHRENYSILDVKHMGNTGIELVLSKLPHKENAIIKKGYFPETAVGIDEKFIFVNLDFDLYKPTLEGLRFFYPKMVKDGIILIHDYFNPGYKGIQEAIYDYMDETKNKLKLFPIGDRCSLGIIK